MWVYMRRPSVVVSVGQLEDHGQIDGRALRPSVIMDSEAAPASGSSVVGMQYAAMRDSSMPMRMAAGARHMLYQHITCLA
jgi:hypothetical protein